MAPVQFIIITILLTTLVLALFVLSKETTVFAKKETVYQTRVQDKKRQSSVIYAGVFVPTVIYYLITEEGKWVTVGDKDFKRLNIGDPIWVSKYSNGKHKLETGFT